MLSENVLLCFMYFFPPAVYVGTLNLIASIPGPSILTLRHIFTVDQYEQSCHLRKSTTIVRDLYSNDLKLFQKEEQEQVVTYVLYFMCVYKYGTRYLQKNHQRSDDSSVFKHGVL